MEENTDTGSKVCASTPWTEGDGGLVLASARAVEEFASLVVNVHDGADAADGLNSDDDDSENDEYHSAKSGSGSATPSVLSIQALTLAIPPQELSASFPTASLVRILLSCASSLTHLRISYSESLLLHNDRIPRSLRALLAITHLVLSEVGPGACRFLQAFTPPLHHVELDFDDVWVTSVICASFGQPYRPDSLHAGLPNGLSSGHSTMAPAHATTPAAAVVAVAAVLPDPVQLLSHSMPTLKTLRASNAIIVTVADKLRYPAVRTLSLRLAGVPTVTPLVHAFPSASNWYVYTPYDGCGMRAAPSLLSNPSSPDVSVPTQKRRLRPPMPDIHATRDANRTSQLYSSFPPLSCVRGFAPGLYSLGLTCPVEHLEIGSLTPPSLGGQEALALRKLLADTMPEQVSLGLGRGWWAPGQVERTRGRERQGLRAIFGGDAPPEMSSNASPNPAWAGVCELVVRVEEPGRWKDVTGDLLAMLLPLANSLTTLVLRWDRTSVPFDRIPLDDDYEDEDISLPSHDYTPTPSAFHSERKFPSRIEAFANLVARELPLLRYLLVEILLDEPYRFPSVPPDAYRPTSYDGRISERRFWRVDRSEGWLCLDALGEGDAAKVLNAQGLSFADRVRY